MASLNILKKTRGVQQLKRMMRGVVPFGLHQQAIRSYKECVDLLKQQEKLKRRLEPMAKVSFDDKGNPTPTAFKLIKESEELIAQYREVCRQLESRPWKFIRSVNKFNKKTYTRLTYIDWQKGKAYVIPHYSVI